MAQHNKGSKRKTAAQWSGLVAAWRRSGKSAAAYAAEKGLNAGSLTWWSWHLKKSQQPGSPAAFGLVRVVAEPSLAVDVVEEVAVSGSWVVRTRRGEIEVRGGSVRDPCGVRRPNQVGARTAARGGADRPTGRRLPVRGGTPTR